MNCLIVGYGSAGKRHERYAKMYELEVATVDPYVPRDGTHKHYMSLDDALKAHKWDCAVIASPPDCHLDQLNTLIQHQIPTLCEKPLCGLGQLARAKMFPVNAPVMVAYNYRYHSNLLKWQGRPIAPQGWALHAKQHRARPPWGFLLDNLSHDLFITDWMSGGIESIDKAWRVDHEAYEGWCVSGKTKTGGLFIDDRVYRAPENRDTHLFCGYGDIEIDADMVMFERLWENFLLENYDPGLVTGIRVQELLERVATIGGNATDGQQ
jgi:hypothetical protein